MHRKRTHRLMVVAMIEIELVRSINSAPNHNPRPLIRCVCVIFHFEGIGMDSAVIPLGKHDLSLVQTVDFFYPLLDDPYTMGRIALANVVSDVYAVGVTEIDRVSMILSASTEFNEQETDVVASRIAAGFRVRRVN